MSCVVAFGGSRALPWVWRDRVRSVVRALLEFSSLSFAVGDAGGADQFAVEALVTFGAARRSRLFAVGAPGGRGAWTGTAVGTVSWAETRGAAVLWEAGGAAGLPLVGRLRGRTRACVRGA